MPGQGRPASRVPKSRPKRRISSRPSSTYANNSLRTPTVSRPGASLGGGKGRTHQSTNPHRNITQKSRQPKRRGRGKGYKNYRITNRNPMED